MTSPTYTGKTKQLIVESKDRDRLTNPDPFSFKIALPNSYRNVIQVELLEALIPAYLTKQYSNFQNFYIYLYIDELGAGNFHSTNFKHDESFTRFCMVKNDPEVQRTIGFDGDRLKRFMQVPIARLDTLTIRLLDEDGNAVNLGNDLLPFDKTYSGDVAGGTTINTNNHGIVEGDVVLIDQKPYSVQTVPDKDSFTIDNSPGDNKVQWSRSPNGNQSFFEYDYANVIFTLTNMSLQFNSPIQYSGEYNDRFVDGDFVRIRVSSNNNTDKYYYIARINTIMMNNDQIQDLNMTILNERNEISTGNTRLLTFTDWSNNNHNNKKIAISRFGTSARPLRSSFLFGITTREREMSAGQIAVNVYR
jgi:hypothetical protein